MRYISLRSLCGALFLSITLAVGGRVQAQDAEVPSASSSIDEHTIDQLADAYIAIQEIQAKANADLQKVDDQQGARAVVENAHNAIIRAVERAGLQVREFNRLSELAALDPTLSARIEARVRERQPI